MRIKLRNGVTQGVNDEALLCVFGQPAVLAPAITISWRPSTARYDRFTKRRLYQEVEIPNYWIVDPDRRLVELWTPDRELPDIERGEVTWHPAGAAQAVTINLEELFRPI